MFCVWIINESPAAKGRDQQLLCKHLLWEQECHNAPCFTERSRQFHEHVSCVLGLHLLVHADKRATLHNLSVVGSVCVCQIGDRFRTVPCTLYCALRAAL